MKKELFKRPRSRTNSLRGRQESKKNPQPIFRSWGLAKRLEHRRIKGKQNN